MQAQSSINTGITGKRGRSPETTLSQSRIERVESSRSRKADVTCRIKRDFRKQTVPPENTCRLQAVDVSLKEVSTSRSIRHFQGQRELSVGHSSSRRRLRFNNQTALLEADDSSTPGSHLLEGRAPFLGHAGKHTMSSGSRRHFQKRMSARGGDAVI